MTQTTLVGPGLRYPFNPLLTGVVSALPNTPTMDATGEKLAFCGQIYIDGRPTSAKTLSSAGGKIYFRTGTVTFANGSTALDIGWQDIDATAGPAPRPDGTFDVKATLVPGVETISSNTWTTATMETGSKSITHGDFGCIVFDMTARAGSDSVILNTFAKMIPGNPCVNDFSGAAWNMSNGSIAPICVIEFDDGTLGTFFETLPLTSATTESYQDGTNPDERGLIFQVPWDCKVDGLFVGADTNFNGNPDWEVKLYEDPLGTPSALKTFTSDANYQGFQGSGYEQHIISPVISLTKNTDYCIAVKATTASSFRLRVGTLADANYRKFMPGGTTLNYATRNNGSGAFSPTTTKLPFMGVNIASFDDGTGTGSGGGMIRHIGMNGGLNA